MPVRICGNFVLGSALTGIALSGGTVAILEENSVADCAMPGIVVNGATALKLNANRVKRVKRGPGFMLVGDAVIGEMLNNAADSVAGPRFMLRGATIGKQTPRP